MTARAARGLKKKKKGNPHEKAFSRASRPAACEATEPCTREPVRGLQRQVPRGREAPGSPRGRRRGEPLPGLSFPRGPAPPRADPYPGSRGLP